MNHDKALNDLQLIIGSLDAVSIASARLSSEKISEQYRGEMRRVVQQLNMIAYDDM